MKTNKIVSLLNANVAFVLMLVGIWYPDFYLASKIYASGLLFLALSIYFWFFEIPERGDGGG